MKRGMIFGALLFAIAVPDAIEKSGLLLNYSASVPVGLYRQSVSGPGTYAAICLPIETVHTVEKAGAEFVKGGCPGDVSPILKPIIRPSAEHPLRFGAGGFSIDGKLLANTAPKARSRTGVPLEHHQFGIYQSGLWAVSSWSPDSLDSRYFGPVAPDAIRFYARPVWTW